MPLLIVGFASRVFAIDRATGHVAWRVELDSDSADTVELAIDERVVIACTCSQLAFVEYQTGTIRARVKRRDVARGSRPTLLVDGDHLYIGGSGQIACYALSGELLWDHGFGNQASGVVALGVPHRVRQADFTW